MGRSHRRAPQLPWVGAVARTVEIGGMKRIQDVALFLLLATIIGQGLYLVLRGASGTDPRVPTAELVVGDTLGFLDGRREDGAPTTVSLFAERGRVTVLYVFDSQCAFCDDVAPAWRRHFANAVTGASSVRRIALTRDLPVSAARYARRFGWQVDLLSVSRLEETSREYSLVSKTPWVFVFDSNGVLRFNDHGAELERIEQALEAISAADAHEPHGETRP